MRTVTTSPAQRAAATTALLDEIEADRALLAKHYDPDRLVRRTDVYGDISRQFDRRTMLEAIEDDAVRRVMAWACEWFDATDKAAEDAEDHLSEAISWMHQGYVPTDHDAARRVG